MKIRKQLYGISRKINKLATTLGDIEAIASGKPKKVINRITNKTKNKVIYKTANKISNKITKK